MDRTRRGALRRLQGRVAVHDGYFEEAPPGITLDNTHLQINPETGKYKRLPHGPDHRSLFRLNVAFDKNAVAPVFTAGLTRLAGGDPVKVRALLEYMAAILFNVAPGKDTERNVLLLVGPTRCGKSAFIRLLERLVPAEARAGIAPELWGNDRYRVQLRGVRLNCVAEMDYARRRISGAWFKRIVSREWVSARDVYTSAVDFRPVARHVFATNGLPTFDERDASVGHRLLIVNCGATIDPAERIANFEDRCWDEAPSIITLLLHAATRLIQRGRFTLPPDNPELIARMQHGHNPWDLLPRLWIEAAVGERLTTAQIQAALRVIAEADGLCTDGWDSATGMRRAAGLIAELHGAKRRANRGVPFYEGVQFTAGFIARFGTILPDGAHVPPTDA